jgi:hypothetical protein
LAPKIAGNAETHSFGSSTAEMFGADLKAEIARVQRELITFRTEYLPALLGTPLVQLMPDYVPDYLLTRTIQIAGRLSEWQNAAIRLAGALPLGLADSQADPLRSNEYAQFMFQPATMPFTCLNGRIVWEISLSANLEMACRFCPGVFGESPENVVGVRTQPPTKELKRSLLRLPVNDPVLWNALCMVLPSLANDDPAFATFVLDPETWKAIVRADASLTNDEKTKRLELIEIGYFRHVLNNALLHVLGALANNHFMAIRDLLEHPHLIGSYTGLMPHYLFAVLFNKVETIRKLAGIGEDA